MGRKNFPGSSMHFQKEKKNIKNIKLRLFIRLGQKIAFLTIQKLFILVSNNGETKNILNAQKTRYYYKINENRILEILKCLYLI